MRASAFFQRRTGVWAATWIALLLSVWVIRIQYSPNSLIGLTNASSGQISAEVQRRAVRPHGTRIDPFQGPTQQPDLAALPSTGAALVFFYTESTDPTAYIRDKDTFGLPSPHVRVETQCVLFPSQPRAMCATAGIGFEDLTNCRRHLSGSHDVTIDFGEYGIARVVLPAAQVTYEKKKAWGLFPYVDVHGCG